MNGRNGNGSVATVAAPASSTPPSVTGSTDATPTTAAATTAGGLPAPVELTTAHAQLVLLEEAIRAAAAGGAAAASSSTTSPSSAVALKRPSEAKRSTSTATSAGWAPSSRQGSLTHAPAFSPPAATAAAAEYGLPTGIMAAPRAASNAASPSGASERLSALHDNLRRVRRLMQEYEEASQRVITVHLKPSSVTGEPILGSVTTIDSAQHAAEAAKSSTSTTAAGAAELPTPHRPSQPLTGASAAQRPSPQQQQQQQGHSLPASPRAAGPPQAPSLHQRRALASDVVFARFCGLRVSPDQLLLALPTPAAAAAPGGGANTSTASPTKSTQGGLPRPGGPQTPVALRGIDDDDAGESGDDSDTALAQSNPSGKTNGSRASRKSSPSPSLMQRLVQQRQRTTAEAALEAYSRFFLYPARHGVAGSGNETPTASASLTAATAAAAASTAMSPLTVGFSPASGVGIATPAGAASPTPSTSLSPATPAAAAVVVAATSAAGAAVVRELQDTESQFAALRRCRLFAYEGQLKALAVAAAAADAARGIGDLPGGTARGGKPRGASGPAPAAAAAAALASMSAGSNEDVRWQHMPVAVQHMQDSLAALQARFTRDSQYANCGAPAVAVTRQLHAWTQPLLRQLNELLSNPTLEEVDEATREKLRRMKFDVEELQQAQAEAIANGDMQHSEELYYEQTSLAEAMTAPYDELEATMQEYLELCVDLPLVKLQEQQELMTSRLTHLIEENAGQLSEVMQDLERVREKRRAVAQTRHRQRNNMSSYHHAWRKAWQANSDQQLTCYRAMEQLEKQLHDLQQANSFLVDDWITRVSQERQREEDAAAFACFADARGAALAETQRNLQAVVDGLRQYSGAVHFSCRHAEAFAREVLQGHVNAAQLALRMDRLAQFRSLYLTLGDLRFKKARNAEEIEKKIEYYTLQQEVAMDALNPKAREYSQAKQRWDAARSEAMAQLAALDQRSQAQLEGFRPTERLLRQAGVDFVSPEEELARRTQQRAQKLIEYQQLIEEGIGVRPPSSAGLGTSSPATAHLAATTSGPTPQPPATGRPMSATWANARGSAPPARLQAVQAVHPSSSSRPPSSDAGTAAEIPRGPQLPPLPNIDAAATPLPPPSSASARAARAADQQQQPSESIGTLHSLNSLHATEERIMHDISKTALVGRAQTASVGGGDERGTGRSHHTSVCASSGTRAAAPLPARHSMQR